MLSDIFRATVEELNKTDYVSEEQECAFILTVS